MSNQKVYAGSLALTKLKSAIITTKKGAKCLLIPIDANYFSEKDGAVYLNCSVIVRDEQDQYGQKIFSLPQPHSSRSWQLQPDHKSHNKDSASGTDFLLYRDRNEELPISLLHYYYQEKETGYRLSVFSAISCSRIHPGQLVSHKEYRL